MQERGKHPKRREPDNRGREQGGRDVNREQTGRREENVQRGPKQDIPDRERNRQDPMDEDFAAGRGEEDEEDNPPRGQDRDTQYWPRRDEPSERPAKPRDPYASD